MHDYISLGITLLAAIFGGGALLTFVQFLIQRKDNNILDAVRAVDKKLDTVKEEVDNRLNVLHRELEDEAAKNSRIRILKFSEEIQRGLKHSKEAFDQVHADIDSYNRHCRKYPDYPNSRAEDAIAYIEKLYFKCLELENAGEQGFLS